VNYLSSLVTRALRSLTASRCDTPEPDIWKKPHVRQSQRFNKRIHIGVRTGRITTGQCDGKYPSKDLSRDIRDGYFTTKCPETGQEVWETNPATGCKYKVYFWTGKLPPHWVNTPSYKGAERRKVVRGGSR
jgi:hypothetical protein